MDIFSIPRVRLLTFSSGFEIRSVSSPYRRGRPLRILAARGHVYVLDSAQRSVRRHARGKDTFVAPPGASYGQAGQGNGKLLRPVDFALTPAGEVAVLDARGNATYFVYEQGEQGSKGSRHLEKPEALAMQGVASPHVNPPRHFW